MRGLLDMARGERKADLLFVNGKVVDVFTGQLLETSVAVGGGVIIGFGDYEAQQVVDLKGRILSPGLIDGHCHVESGMSEMGIFAQRLIALGTTTIFADPHEIANVAGLEGIRYMLQEGRKYPWNFNLMLPSCVPASPFETAGAILEAQDLAQLVDEDNVFGLGEVMNYPGVVNGDADLWKKLELFKGKFIDGHAPDVRGKELNAYLLGGIKADHEVTTAPEAREKVSSGMYVMIREGSAARNMEALLPAVDANNYSRFLFCTDDRDPGDLLNQGHMNYLLKRACELGMEPVDAIRMATINAANCFGLDGIGGIAPGRRADLVVFDDLLDFKVQSVYKDGKLVAQDGEPLFDAQPGEVPERVGRSVNVKVVTPQDFEIPTAQSYRVIELVPGQIVTSKAQASLDEVRNLTDNNLARMAVVERHKASGRVGLGILKGLGIKKGAVATSIAHDSHHIIVAGIEAEDLALAVSHVAKMQGGLVVVRDGEIRAQLPLPIAGLMATAPMEQVAKQLEQVEREAKNLGVDIKSPFMTLSFLALPVIPTLKLTDKGLFDVSDFKPVDLGH